jgi:hypothetical protein
MPIVPIVHVSRRVTVTKQGSTQRPYSCASCGYRAHVEISAAVRAGADGSIVKPVRHIEAEARERAEAGLADEMQDLFDLVPCPECGARSENAGLYGAFFMLLGLVLPRVRRNPWIGVRTPWTLASDENWAKTHRFAGYTMTLGGGAAVVASMAGVPALALAFILAGALAPAFYSWRIARSA